MVRIARRGGTGEVILSAPERLNSFTSSDLRELGATLEAMCTDRYIRAVVLRGEGRGFCAGADRSLLEVLEGATPAAAETVVRAGVELVQQLVALPVPTVAVVQGPCYGGGVSLALACDVVVAAEDTTLGLVFTRLGLPGGDMLATWLLSRRCGGREAFRLLSTGALLNSGDAHRRRLVDEVCASPDQALTRARDIAEGWASGPVNAITATKRQVLRLEAIDELERQAEFEIDCMTRAVAGEEFRLGRQAAVAGHDPDFSGVARVLDG